MSCGVGRRRSLALALLWLWRRPAAIAPIGPLAWEPPYAAGAALKSKKKQKPKFLHFTNEKMRGRSSHCGLAVINLTRLHEDVGLIPGLTQWVKDPVLL